MALLLLNGHSMDPWLSVIIPTYNGETYIAAALESVCRQFDHGIEVLVVDDGSTDGSMEIVRDFVKPLSIRLITPGRLGNWVATSNLGLREARGEWACFLHQDDLWLPGRIERLRSEMKSAEGALIFHNAMFVGPNGGNLGRWTCPFAEGDVSSDSFIERLLVQNFIAIPSPVFRRKPVLNSGAMDETLWFTADWDLWLRLGAFGPARFVSETLSAFRVHPASQTAARKLLPNEWEQQLNVVFARHLRNWSCTGKCKLVVERVGRVSIAVNCALAASSRGEPFQPWAVIRELCSLGPSGFRRYLRDSRIVQRVRSRLKVR